MSICDRLIELLHAWTSYVIVPVFALANAGIVLSGGAFTNPSSILVGVVVGLVVGKLAGITGFTWLAIRFHLATLPSGVSWRHVGGVASLAGIGFTVSLFITSLAFADPELQNDAKTGILAASILAATVGASIIIASGRRSDRVPVSSTAPPRRPAAAPRSSSDATHSASNDDATATPT